MSITLDGTSGITTPTYGGADTAEYLVPVTAFKNRIINGGMTVAQRATSATITAGSTIAAGYSTLDRFYVYCTGANVTAAQVAGSGAVQNRLQITGAASVTAVGVGQRIEQRNSYDLAGSTCTLSVDLANSALTTVTWTAFYANTADTFGTLASPTRTQIATGTFTVTSTVTNYNAQIAVPAAATTGVEIVFTVGAQTSGTWTIGNVQFERGTNATLFDVRPYTTELALCQRYYRIIGQGAISVARATTQVVHGSSYQDMRAAPTATLLTTSPVFYNFATAANTTGSGSTINDSSLGVAAAQVNLTGFSGLTAGQSMSGVTTAITSLSAEL
jgi:hypothetical protein